ncbi:hypothetical protein [Terrihabitans rhizophilus]|jgi:hypothetical protein|uniref:Uncharacterized protein n=1 Tax=Terrihabitans rhizophilus TaxID=3092662 RepID=A0ABU4RKR4_9HYPH|nr:hypothetical protein [Terrihabitans sp. PJ23]MDX6805433.1 hypothetical protein [Terrihabitans sp. PJ23]
MSTISIEPLHSRIWSGKPRAGDDRRLARALGFGPDETESLALCQAALAGNVDAALDLWRACRPGQSLRIQVTHTPSALKMCAHLLKQAEGE